MITLAVICGVAAVGLSFLRFHAYALAAVITGLGFLAEKYLP